MKVDITRDTFRPERHYSSVRLEQGRVQLDADWNEQVAIDDHFARAEGEDVIGEAGAPKHDPGFAITATPDGADLLIDPGHFYVDGILCELESTPLWIASYGPGPKQAKVDPLVARQAKLAKTQWIKAWAKDASKPPIYTSITDFDPKTGLVTLADEIKTLGNPARLRAVSTYKTQPEWAAPLNLPLGDTLVYLDVWERAITALDDDKIREPALGGVETATRTKIIWQVKLLALGAGPTDCSKPIPLFDSMVPPPTGRLAARAKRNLSQIDPCVVPTDSSYRRLENQLYRVEIHDPGSLADGKATFKWSRDNGSVVSKIVAHPGNQITIAPVPRDAEQGFAAGQWVEISDDATELAGKPGFLIRLSSAQNEILMTDPTSVATPIDWTKFDKNTLKIRRWDNPKTIVGGALKVASDPATDDGYLKLEDGVQIKFSDGTYTTGDYWLIPARTITGDVEWPNGPDPADATTQTPIPQLRRGIRHHLARLGVVTVAKQGTSTVTTVADCRRLFPPLNDIAADDVSVDSKCNLLTPAKTVQQALDILCEERDLTFHNQHLHGYGIVCGLQVHCGPDTPTSDPKSTVHDGATVMNGYAIDWRGRDIIVDAVDGAGQPDTGDHLKILQMLRDAKLLLDAKGGFIDGSVMLKIQDGATAKDRYGLELYDSTLNEWKHVFDNTFVWDFYQDCIVPLITAFTNEFTGDEAWEHLITFLNLLVQIILPQSGQNVFISPEENQILVDFYNKLRDIIESKTFCAEFNGRTFPDYNKIYNAQSLGTDPRPSTIFSNQVRLNQRIRVQPDGKYAYLVGTNAHIQVADVQYSQPQADSKGNLTIFPDDHEKFVTDLVFPTQGAVVQDVAFSADGRSLYAIATINNSDSLLATADISDPTNIKWTGTVTTVCSYPLVSLAYSAAQNIYCAIGLGNSAGAGKGLFVINPSNLVPAQQPNVGFDPCGHVEIADTAVTSFAYVTVGTGTSITAIGRIDLRGLKPTATNAPAPLSFVYDLTKMGLKASADLYGSPLAIAIDPGSPSKIPTPKLFTVVDPNVGAGQRSKQLVAFDAVTATPPNAPLTTVDLAWAPPPNNTSSSDKGRYNLAFNGSTLRVMIASTDAGLVRWYNAQGNTTTLDGAGGVPFAHPTQLAPVGIAYNSRTPGQPFVFILNAFSMTINNVPASFFGAKAPPAIILSELATYHNLALEAYIDLFAGLLQYLKDCFCDHFLVKCPDNKPKTLYLARIDIKGGQIFNICNFSRRKYVHSFPTVEYWASIVPIFPVLKKLIADACCHPLLQFFSNLNAPDATKRGDLVYSSTALNGIGAARNFNVGGMFQTQVVNRLGFLSGVGKSIFTANTDQPAPPAQFKSAEEVPVNSLTGQPPGAASQTLAGKNITVNGTEQVTAGHVVDAFTSPTSLKPGDQVTILVDSNGRTLGFKKTGSSTPAPVAAAGTDKTRPTMGELAQPVETISTALAKRDAQIGQLKDSLTNLKSGYDLELAARDQQIAALNARLDAITKALGAAPPRK